MDQDKDQLNGNLFSATGFGTGNISNDGKKLMIFIVHPGYRVPNAAEWKKF